MLARLNLILLLALGVASGCIPVGNDDLPIDRLLVDGDGDGSSPDQGDCDDDDAAVGPGAQERCDEADNDCDGQVDEGFDQDDDGFATCQHVTAFLDCDDTNPDVWPGAPEVCDGVDNDCDDNKDEGFDLDKDGVSTCVFVDDPPDCDDDDPANYPGNRTPQCDGADNDCDGDADEGYDHDGDDFPRCSLGGLPADCDDFDADVHPGAAEICDAADDDCDRKIDEGFDGDGDGYFSCRSATAGGDPIPQDCDDSDRAVHPGAQEVCAPTNLGVDEDCDDLVDDADPSVTGQLTYYRDADGDGSGAAASPRLACSLPEGYVAVAGDCDDGDPGLSPDTAWYPDQDRDGVGLAASPTVQCARPGEAFSRVSGDCDDGDPQVRPGAVEVCDGADDDCDEAADEGLAVDVDQDGYSLCDGGVPTDCDDGRADVNPGAAEVCAGVAAPAADDDCDGATDEGFDLDADGFTVCGSLAADPDCDDADPDISPGAAERCDEIDHDCDGPVDEGLDLDGDGWSSCVQVSDPVDCDDADPAVHPTAEERCDRGDDDCDGATDETFDGDGDGAFTCQAPGDPAPLDCDDADPDIYPGAPERCDRGDDDCDDAADEDFDLDRDGFYTCAPDGDDTPQDCDDLDDDVYPGADEPCDGVDTDCSGGPGDFYVSGDMERAADFRTVQAAINALATGCAIGVGPGTYNERIDFKGKGIRLISDEGPEVTILNAALGGSGASAVVFAANEPATALLEGFTVTGGGAAAPPNIALGGGVRIEGGAAPTLRGNIITGNIAESGGGVSCNACGAVVLEGNIIRANRAQHRVGPLGLLVNGVGGGVWISAATVTLRDNLIEDNVGTVMGGGLMARSTAVITLDGGSFVGNSTDTTLASRGGGAMILDTAKVTAADVTFEENAAFRGGGVAVELSGQLLGQRLSFVGNEATGRASSEDEGWGGGLYANGDDSHTPKVTLDAARFEDNVVGTSYDGRGGGLFVGYVQGALTHSVIAGNEATLLGGGAYVFLSTFPVTNCVFEENEAALGGGAALDSLTAARVSNNTFYANRSLNGAAAAGGGAALFLFDTGGQLYNNLFASNVAVTGGAVYYYKINTAWSASTLQYGDFFANQGGNSGGEIVEPVASQGNIGVDPQFTDAAHGDLTLTSASPLLDAGHPDSAFFDPDGSRNQIGAFGGPGGGWADEDAGDLAGR